MRPETETSQQFVMLEDVRIWLNMSSSFLRLPSAALLAWRLRQQLPAPSPSRSARSSGPVLTRPCH